MKVELFHKGGLHYLFLNLHRKSSSKSFIIKLTKKSIIERSDLLELHLF